MEESEWRLEPEGEAKVPEIIIVSDAVEGTFVDLDCESRSEQVEAKLSRREREAPSEEGEEIKSQKRKVIGVESEETQDYVTEAKSGEQEEEEERVFLPSAISVPLKPLFRCDNQCIEKSLGYWQLASVVVNEGDEANTTNLRRKCFNKHLQAKGEKQLSNVQWRQVVEKKACRGRMWKMMEKEPYLRGMWEYFLQERSRVKRFRELVDENRQAGIQGKRQQESPAREYLEQVKCCHDTDCNEPMMKSFTALEDGNWEEYKATFRRKMKASEWAFDRIKEAFRKVAQDEAEKVSFVQEIMLRSTDYMRRITAPVGGQGGVTMSYLCPHCNSFPLGRLLLVGFCEKTYEMVVRNLWRKV